MLSSKHEEGRLVVSYLEGTYFKEKLPEDFKKDNGGISETKPEINGKVKMITSYKEVEVLLKSAEKWVAGKLGFMKYSDITPRGNVIDEAKILYAAARLHCKKMKDSDKKKDVGYSTTCLKEHELFQGAVDILNGFNDDKDDGKDLINQNLTGWV